MFLLELKLKFQNKMLFSKISFGEIEPNLNSVLEMISTDFPDFEEQTLKRLTNSGGFILLKDKNNLCGISSYNSDLNGIFVSKTNLLIEDLKSQSCGYLGFSWLDPKVRGNNYQQKFIEFREEILKNDFSLNQVISLVNFQNLASLKSLTNSGFQKIGTLEIQGEYYRDIYHKYL